MSDTAWWKCWCGHVVSGETVADATFVPRMESHEMTHRIQGHGDGPQTVDSQINPVPPDRKGSQ